LPDLYVGSGGSFLGTHSEEDIQSGRAIFSPEKCSDFSVGKTTKGEVVEKLGHPVGWSTEPDGTSLLEYDYVQSTGTLGMRQVIATFFSFDRSLVLFKIKCPGFEQTIAPKDVAPVNYTCDAPVPLLAADKAGPLKINNWFSKDHNSVYVSGRPIPGADPDSFRLACCTPCEVCGEDKNRCYWFEHPVPCNCGKHSGAEFPGAMVGATDGKAVISNPFFIRGGLPEGSYLSAGYRLVQPGTYILDLECRRPLEQKPMPLEFPVTMAAGLYRLERAERTTCDFKMTRPAMVVGRKFGPEIWLHKAGDRKPSWQLELESGIHTITAICREVQRSGIRQDISEITIELSPGEIYQLDAEFIAPEYQCKVKPKRPLQ
jgi:hypothetical protein